MSVRFERTTVVPAPIEEVFDRSLSTDLHLESFADSGEEMIEGPDSDTMEGGDTVTWRARHFGVWWTMTSIISDYERPTMFVDEQHRGPFRRFRHLHRFRAHGDGKVTVMIDEVEFEAPLGPLGAIAERVFLRPRLEQLIDARNQFLVDSFLDPDS